MIMNLDNILLVLGGGLGGLILKFISDSRQAKQENTKDSATAWQEIANRDGCRLEKLEERVKRLEDLILISDRYIYKLERIIIDAGLKLPDRDAIS